MPKASTRFRNRKINFKTRIAIRTGCLDVPSDHEDEEFGFEEDRRPSVGGTAGERIAQLETGVDKEEESEHHLQKVISASTAALLRSAVNDQLPSSSATLKEVAQAALDSSSAPGHLSAVPHIPIPDATGLVDPAAYEALYAHSKIFLPSSYIRFSDTVEDTLGGVIYTMDEEDEIWLKEFNSDPALRNRSQDFALALPEEATKGKRSNARKGKEKERPEAEFDGPARLSEDDFETIMDHFEKTTEETVPGLHLDTNRLPSLADFEHTFEGTLINPRLSTIKIFAKFVYSHWKERRLKRGGKPIMPAIDFDESNENNPYVCFRRREIKTVRKTRRTDAQNMDRLIRLRDDLHKAQELLNTVLSRERVKREVIELEKAIFEGRCMIREMKRALKEPDGDENLLIDKKEKKRKREGSGFGIAKSPFRKGDGPSTNGYGIHAPTCPEDILLLLEKAKATSKNMDRELLKRKEEQNGWEDLTDSAYQSMAFPASTVRWRGALVSDTSSITKSGRELAPGFEQGITFATPVVENNQYRKRVGRGGRYVLDRIIAPSQRNLQTPYGPVASTSASPWLSADDEAARRQRIAERWRYDDDLRNEFPSLEDPPFIDDYDLQYTSKRRNLLDLDDLDCLQSHSDLYLARVTDYLNQEPDPEPPVVTIGKLPGKPVPNILGMGFPRAQYQTSASGLQEQMMALQAAVHAHGNAALHGKRTTPTAVPTHGNSAAQLNARARRVPPVANGVVHTNGTGSGAASHTSVPTHQHSHGTMAWSNGAAISTSTPAQNGSNPLHSGTTASNLSSAPIASISNNVPSGLSRSIPVPANSATRMMNGINIPANMSNGTMLMSHPAIGPSSVVSPAHQQRIGSPFGSRPGSAASPSPQPNPSHPSPGGLHKSPGTRPGKRPASSLGVQQPSPPSAGVSNHGLSLTPSPSPSATPAANGANNPSLCNQRIYASPPSNHQLSNQSAISPPHPSKTVPCGPTHHSPVHHHPHQLLSGTPAIHAANVFTPFTRRSPGQTPNPGAATTG